MSQIPTVHDFLNYRDYLRELFGVLKQTEASFSHKRLLSALRITSTGFLSNVIAGRKSLTPIQATKLAEALGMHKADAAYFEALVFFTQARTLEEKEEYYSRLVRLQKIKFRVIDGKKLSLFAKWYYVAIRELLYFVEIGDGDIGKLAAMTDPAIKPLQAREALADLVRMGLVRRDENGVYRQVDAALTTGDEVKSMHLMQFQLDTMDLAKRALQKVPAVERDVSVLTMTLSPDAFHMVKSEIQAFRKRIAKIAVDDAGSNRVYQMNMQLFPLSRSPKEDEHA